MLNSVGARTQPCLTLLVTRRVSDGSPSSTTLAVIPTWNRRTFAMNLRGQPNFPMIFQSPSRLTVPKALDGSTKVCRRRGTVRCISPGAGGRQKSCQWSLDLHGSRIDFQEETLLQVFQQVVDEDAGQYLSCYRLKGDSSVVIAGLAISFPLVDVASLSELLR